MAWIEFNDGVNGQILSFLTSAGPVATRFSGWTPFTVDVGDRAAQMSTGRITAAFIYHTQYGVTFEHRNLSVNGPSAVNTVAVAQRFIRWASNGGLFLVYPEDDVGSDTAGRNSFAPTPPILTLADPRQMLYTLQVTAVSVSATPWQAIYGGARA